MYYARLRFPPCVGCGRGLAAAAARCPDCGMHVRHSIDVRARVTPGRVAADERRSASPHRMTQAGVGESR